MAEDIDGKPEVRHAIQAALVGIRPLTLGGRDGPAGSTESARASSPPRDLAGPGQSAQDSSQTRIPDRLRSQLVEQLDTAREHVDAAKRSLADLDLPGPDAQFDEFHDLHSTYLPSAEGALNQTAPEIRQRFVDIGTDWKDRLERAEGQVGPIAERVDAAVTGLGAAAKAVPAMPGQEGWTEGLTLQRDVSRIQDLVRDVQSRMVDPLAGDLRSAREGLDEVLLDDGANGSGQDLYSASVKVVDPHMYVNGLNGDRKPTGYGTLSYLDSISSELGELSSAVGDSGSATTAAEQDLRLRTQARPKHAGKQVGT